MTYDRFEDVPVWKDAADLAAEMFTWTRLSEFRINGDLVHQIRRATLSVSNNIAEGFERGTTKELIAFLYYARGSAAEVRSMLCVMERMSSFVSRHDQLMQLKGRCESISRQIRGWANALQNSDIEGPRHLTDKARAEFERRKKRRDYEIQHRQWREQMEQKLQREAAQRRVRDAPAESEGECGL